MQRGPETQSADGNAWVIWSRHCDCMSEEAAEVELDSNNGGVSALHWQQGSSSQ